jgi:hypothetical protein
MNTIYLWRSVGANALDISTIIVCVINKEARPSYVFEDLQIPSLTLS